MSLISQPAGVLACLSHPRTSRKRLEIYRDRRLRRLLQHASQHSSFYRRRWDESGVSPFAEFGRLPIVDRNDLQAGDAITRAIPKDRLIRHTTSGTTAPSFEIVRTAAELELLRLFLWRALWQQGWRCHDHLARIWTASSRTRKDSLLKKLLDRAGVFRRSDVEWPQPPVLAADAIRRLRPTVLRGGPTALARVTHALQPEEIARLGVKRLFVDGEFLSRPVQRYLDHRWAARVFEIYGSTEFFCMAWTCPDCGLLHTCDDSVVLEVIRADGQPAATGETGEIVATALHGYTLPLIRYRTGDLAVQGPPVAPCGRPFGSLQKVLGRIADTIVLPGDQIFHSSELENIFDDMPWVREFQLMEEEPGLFTLRIIPCAAVPDHDPGEIEKRLQLRLGPATRVVVQLVSDLPLGPTGKLRLLVRKGQRA